MMNMAGQDLKYTKPTEEEVNSWSILKASNYLKQMNISYANTQDVKDMRMLIKRRLCETQSDESEQAVTVDCQSLIKELMEKNTKMKDELLAVYENLMAFLASKDIQRSAMKDMYLDERDYLESRFNDHSDKNEKCPIVVAGETSSGKSSFLNLLLGPDSEILPHSSLPDTSIICRLHNSQEKKFICYENNNQITETKMLDAAATCENMQEKLAPFISTREGSMGQLSHVDIFWPIPMIQDPVILVDTPGIGESEGMTDKLLHYLPNAVAFIYVISSGKAGGIKEDRLLRIRSELLRLESERKWFVDPKSAIFVCNKWDWVQTSGEEDKVWKDTLAKIKKGWPGVQDSQIFKMSTTNALRLRKQLEITEDFKKVLEGLKNLVPITLEARIKQHYKLLEAFISKLESCVAKHISNARSTQEERKMLSDAVFSRVNNLKIHKDKAQKKLHSEADKACKELADKLFNHMQTEGVQKQLFTWDDKDAPKLAGFTMEQVREQAEHKIKQRFQTILNEWEQRNSNAKAISDKLTKLFYDECHILDKECQQINLMIEKPGGSLTCFEEKFTYVQVDSSFSKAEIAGIIISAPVWVPLIIISLPVLVGLAIRSIHLDNQEEKGYIANKAMKMQEWAKEFWDKNLTKFNIDLIIESAYFQEFTNKIKTVFEEQIPRQIAADEKTMNDIANELRSSTEIYNEYCPIQMKIQIIKGSLLLFDLKYFASDLVLSQNVTPIESDPIGSGSFADVWKVKWNKSENEVVMAALKRPRNKPGDHDIFEQHTEVQCLRAFQCQHIVKLFGVLYDVTNGQVQPLLELCEETLETYFFKHENRICGKHNDISKRREAFRVYVAMITGVSDGLAYIHHQGYLHRDLKMTNILVKNGIPKICDVGLAKRAELVTGTFTGNIIHMAPEVMQEIIHMAPEVMQENLYTFSADVYSLGIILWETWYGQQAFTSDQFMCMSLPDLINHITGGQRLTFENVRPWHDLESLISKCWHQDEKVRPQAAAIKSEILQIERNNTK